MVDINEALEDTRNKQVAAMAAGGASQRGIAEALNISQRQVRNALAHPDCQAAIREIGDQAMSTAKSVIRAKTADMVDAALDALKRSLKKDQIEAIKLVFRTVGVLDPQEQTKGDTNITVLIPGQKPEEVIIPSYEVQDEK